MCIATLQVPTLSSEEGEDGSLVWRHKFVKLSSYQVYTGKDICRQTLVNWLIQRINLYIYDESTMKIQWKFDVFLSYFQCISEFIWCDLKWNVKNIPLPSYFSTTRCTMRLTPRRGWQTSWGSSWRRWQEDTLLCQLVGDSWIVIKVSWLSHFHPQVASGDRFSARSCTPSIPQTWQRRSRTDSLRGRTGEINYW